MTRRIKITPEELGELRSRLEDPRPALRRIGALMLAESQKSFLDQRYGPEQWPERYEGQPDPFVNVAGALSDLNRDRQIKGRRFDRRPALVDTAALKGSLSFDLRGKNAVRVGSTIPYAAKQVFGLNSRQSVTGTARKRLTKEYRRFKKQGGSRFEAIKKLGFLHTVSQLDTSIQARPFIGIFPDLEKRVVGAVEDYIAEGAA